MWNSCRSDERWCHYWTGQNVSSGVGRNLYFCGDVNRSDLQRCTSICHISSDCIFVIYVIDLHCWQIKIVPVSCPSYHAWIRHHIQIQWVINQNLTEIFKFIRMLIAALNLCKFIRVMWSHSATSRLGILAFVHLTYYALFRCHKNKIPRFRRCYVLGLWQVFLNLF